MTAPSVERLPLGLSDFARPLIGMPVSHVWRGHGSAIFVEFGELKQPKIHPRNGSLMQPDGEMGLMIEWSWRIEGPRSIVCGSWSSERRWPAALRRLLGARVVKVETFGRLPELSISLSNNLHLASLMTAEGQPQWSLFDRRSPATSRA